MTDTDLVTMFQSLQTSLDAHRRRTEPGLLAPTDNVPVTVLTGFLGAGKSTLLSALLTSPPDGLIIKAIVNDVGDLGFDPSLVVDGGSLDVELSNGCGCCSGAGQLGEAIDRAATTEADLIVLEASGMTDPFAIAQVVEASPAAYLDRIVAVVSATALRTQLDDDLLRPTVVRQLEASESVIVSRADQIDQTELGVALELAASLVPGRVVRASPAEGLAPLEMLVPHGLRGAALPPTTVSMASHDLVSASLDQRGPIESADLDRVLSSPPTGIVRCKGTLVADGRVFSVQWTTDGWTIGPPAREAEPGLLVVGRSHDDITVLATRLNCRVAHVGP